uniref:Uncharacterized protein n=1 Tax=Arundo donax TaxID=35708 RepID=A0A0A9DPX2_ARUDO
MSSKGAASTQSPYYMQYRTLLVLIFFVSNLWLITMSIGTTNVLDQSCSPVYDTTKSSLLDGGPRCNKENNFTDENAVWLCRNDTFGRDQENVVNITQANNSPIQLPGIVYNYFEMGLFVI